MLPRPTSLPQDLAPSFREHSAIGCTACEPPNIAFGDDFIGNISVAEGHILDSGIDVLLQDVKRSPGEV